MRFLVIQDYKENLRKCTLTPLEGREDFTFLRLEHPSRSAAKVEIPSGLLLLLEGPPLSLSDASYLAESPLVIVDSTWARVPKVLARLDQSRVGQLERRSIPADIVTAYPRASKLYQDPATGLASVEAVFAATVVLRDPRWDILSGYPWAKEFLARNESAFQRLCPNLILPA